MILETFRWWLVISVIGLIALPIAMTLFRRLPGQGIAFAKPLGLLLTGYLFWLLLSLHLMNNRPGTIIWVLIALAALDYLLLRRHWREYLEALQERQGLFIATEVVFLVGLFVAAHIKSFIPEISGTEKPMDFMFLNASSRSTYYAPNDPWLAGYGISYYYFGYVINAMVGKLAALDTAVTFNLALAGTVALAATAAFGLGFEIVSALRRVAFRTAVGVGVAAIIVCHGGRQPGGRPRVRRRERRTARLRRVRCRHIRASQRSGQRFLSDAGGLYQYPTDQTRLLVVVARHAHLAQRRAPSPSSPSSASSSVTSTLMSWRYPSCSPPSASASRSGRRAKD